MHYEYWQHTSGEKYLIQLDSSNAMTGICGPMQQADIPAENRHNFEYDAQPRYMAWVLAHLPEFRRIGVGFAA